MKTIIKIAWRNIWRNKLRSGVVFASIVLGIWAGLFVVSLSVGMIEQQKRGVINAQISHLKIHTKSFLIEETLESYISTSIDLKLVRFLKNDPRIKSFTKRMILDGTGTTAHGFANLKILGISPEIEKLTTSIHEKLDTGTYFTKYKNGPILIGSSLADKLHLSVGKSINISIRDKAGNFVQKGFRVEGIFNTANANYDQSHVFVLQNSLNKLALTDQINHEFAVMLNNIEDVSELNHDLNNNFPEITARSWKELSPELSYQDEMMGTSLMLILIIIIFALTFGIVNTMLMAVLERKRELGMLMCVGMNKSKIFFMIMLESFFLSIAATPIGLLISWITISYFEKNGISLLSVEDAMYKFGIDATVYTKLDLYYYIVITTMIIIASIVSSIYPARKALKYNPAEAVSAL